jgi:hypothetical protein
MAARVGRSSHRRLLAGAAAAAFLGSIGLGALPAGAATSTISPGNLGPWQQTAFDCDTGTDLTTTQSFVEGPAPTPAGTGSIKYDFTGKDEFFTDVLLNESYAGTPVSSIEGMSYSTYLATAGADEAPAFGFGVDTNADGSWDEDVTYYPSLNGAVQLNTWQTWTLAAGSQFLVETDTATSGPVSWSTYQSSHPGAKLVYVAVAYGCAYGAATGGTVSYVDQVTVDVAGRDADVSDFESKAPAAPAPGPGETPTGGNGYRMVAADGGIFTFGARTFHGSTGDIKLNKPIVGGATDTSDYDGYWIVASDGGIFAFNAEFYGSLGDKQLSAPAVEIEPTPTGRGYFIVLADGTVHPFGDAAFAGDLAGKALNKPIIGMSVTPTGKGYWLVGADGGIFNFGDAGFFGSMGDKKLNSPIIDLAPAVDNNGYYLLGGDGGVFTFGSADFKGSTGDMKLNAPVVAMLVAPTGAGYWLAASDGGLFTFGAVDYLGSMGGTKLNSPVLDLIN